MGGYISASNFWSIRSDKDWDYIEQELAGEIPKLDRIQINEHHLEDIGAKTWQKLNDLVFPHNPNITFRYYGGIDVDLSFMSNLTRFKNISIECSGTMSNANVLGGFDDLSALVLVFDTMENIEFVSSLNPHLEKIWIHQNIKRTKNPSLEPICRFEKLKLFSLNGYDNKLAALIGKLPNLETLALRSIKKPNSIDFIDHLQNLEKLVVQLGSVYDLEGLRAMKNIQYLQLWQITKLADISFLSEMTGLQHLNLETLNKMTGFPSMKKLKNLRRIEMRSCKLCRDFTQLEQLTSLNDFIFGNAKTQSPEDFVPVLKNENISSIGIGFPRRKEQEEIEALMKKYKRIGMTHLYPTFDTEFEFI